jgi:oxalate---CoA ligase
MSTSSVYSNISEILTDSFSPAIILPETNYKLYYSSIRHAYEHLRQTNPFCNLKTGDIVTASLPNSVAFVVTMFTVFSVRATFNPIKVSMDGARFEEHIAAVKPRIVITSEATSNFKEVVRVALKMGIPVFFVSCELIEQRFRTPSIIRQFSPIVAHHVKTVTPKFSIQALSETELPRSKFSSKFDRNDVALLIQTHGTTGHTKLVPLTHGNVLDNLELTAGLFELSANDTSYLIMAMYHTHGLIGVLLTSFFAGSTVLLAVVMTLDNFWKNVLRYRVTWYSAVPLFHKMLLTLPTPDLDKHYLYLRFVQSCGYHLESGLVLQLEQLLRVPVVTSYSMTEASHMVSTTLSYRTRKLGSVGQPEGISVAIFDDSNRKLLSGMGEICLSGSTVFKGTYF